jgi:hypothetical protein
MGELGSTFSSALLISGTRSSETSREKVTGLPRARLLAE